MGINIGFGCCASEAFGSDFSVLDNKAEKITCTHEFKIKGGEGTTYSITKDEQMLFATKGEQVLFCIHCGRNYLLK